MVLDGKQYLKEQVTKMADRVSEMTESKRIQEYLSFEDDKIRSVKAEIFRSELLAAHLALGAIFWESCCKENGITGEESCKYFLRCVMDRFKSPADVGLAAIFSEYFCAPNVELDEGPIVAIARRFFERMALESSEIQEKGRCSIKQSFLRFVEVLESFRSEFEKAFFEMF